jgi:hypothetical protein
MHHSLKFYDSYPLRLYSRYRELVLRFYMFGTMMTRLPLLGGLVRMVANLYGRKMERGYLLTLSEAEQAVDIAEGLAVGPCTCRTVFHNCDNPVQAEIMLGLTRNVFINERPQDYREITREEARDILRECHSRGLIHAIIKCRQDFYAICNCCSCCCVPLRMSKRYGIGNAISRNSDIIREFRQHQLAHAD